MCDLLAEDTAQVHSFAFQGGREEAVIDAEHLGVQIQILHLEKKRNDVRLVCLSLTSLCLTLIAYIKYSWIQAAQNKTY